MKLRTSKILKMVAILLFSLESLVPTAFSFPYGTPDVATLSKVEKAFVSQNPHLSLFTEACDTEEREDSISKVQVDFTYPSADQSFLTMLDEGAAILSLCTQKAWWASAPPLFKLHCVYTI
jgi:hypothetical protein